MSTPALSAEATPDASWEFATYCARCDARYDKAEEKLWCGDTAKAHQWRRDDFRGLLDLISEAGLVAYVHDPNCAIWKPLGSCNKECGRRAYEAARPSTHRVGGDSNG